MHNDQFLENEIEIHFLPPKALCSPRWPTSHLFFAWFEKPKTVSWASFHLLVVPNPVNHWDSLNRNRWICALQMDWCWMSTVVPNATLRFTPLSLPTACMIVTLPSYCSTVELPQSITTNTGLQPLLLFLRKLPQKKEESAMWNMSHSHQNLPSSITTTAIIQIRIQSKNVYILDLIRWPRRWYGYQESKTAFNLLSQFQTPTLCHIAHTITILNS